MSEPKILEVLHTVGLCISAGQLSDVLIKDQEPFPVESAKVLQAGLSSCPWHHLESTGTRVNGQNQPCHVLCNPLSTAYCTTLSKDRMTMLRVLLGGADPTFRLNEVALELLPQLGVGKKWCTKLIAVLPYDQEWKEKPIDALLDESLPTLAPILRKGLKDALAIAAYRTQTTYPVVDLLICDDAPQFNWLTAELALCWIQESRHDRKLVPRFAHHCHILEDFSQSFWKLYRNLLAYRAHEIRNEIKASREQCKRGDDRCMKWKSGKVEWKREIDR